jgi:uncharacterized delta-60 repeat protein
VPGLRSLFLGLACALASAAPALAAPSDLDPSFGLGGRATIASESSIDLVQIATDPTGRIVAVGRNGESGWVVRFLPNGQLDPSFNGNGEVLPQVSEKVGGDTELSAMAIQPNGQIVVGGHSTASDGSEAAVVFRLNDNGTMDAGFGSGGGIRRPPVGGNDSIVQGMTILPGGKIAVTGVATTALGPNHGFEVVFNSNGTYAAGPTTDDDGSAFFSVVAQSSGRLLFIGELQPPAGGQELFLRGTDGALNDDPSFGDRSTPGSTRIQLGQPGGGKVARSSPGRAQLLGDGSIVLTGFATDAGGVYELMAARFTANGALDRSFGTNGTTLLQAGGGANPSTTGYGLALDGSGRIVIAGRSTRSDGQFQQTLARLSSGGAPDATFAPGGFANFAFATTSSLGDVAVRADGRIVAVGWGAFLPGNSVAGLLRLIGDQAQAPGGGGGGSPKSDRFVGASLLAHVAKVSGRFALVRHKGPATTPGFCAITDTLTRTKRSTASARPKAIGSGRITLKPGRTGTVKVKLSRSALKALRRSGKLSVRLTSVSSDGLGTKKTRRARLKLQLKRRR